MIDLFLLIGLPYLALFIFVVGCIWRWRFQRYTVSSLSSQFLENRQLFWGSTPWHVGILLVLVLHLIAWLFPQIWSSLMSIPAVLRGVEAAGIGLSLLAVIGLIVLLIRRLTSDRVQAVTTLMDLVVVALLLAQVILGLLTAILCPHGAAWATGTAVPYVWSILTLQPKLGLVADFPAIFKCHVVGAWVFIMIFPFTRLVHVLSLPLSYLWRVPQIVLWNNPRRREQLREEVFEDNSRRDFIKGAIGVAFAGGLLSMGVGEKLFSFFRGPRQEDEAGSDLLAKKLDRLQQTAEERELELERQKNQMILVSRYSELDEVRGKYFIDYAMAPGLAFKGKDGVPILISAKCTHLGCTVGSEMDTQGRIRCPCHVSYFDIKTGKPNEGAPAKAPLPHLAWALVDGSGKVVATSASKEAVKVDPAQWASFNVYITKPERNV